MLLGIRVVADLRRRDRRAIDSHHHRIFWIGLDQRQNPKEALLPGKPRLTQLRADRIRGCNGHRNHDNQTDDRPAVRALTGNAHQFKTPDSSRKPTVPDEPTAYTRRRLGVKRIVSRPATASLAMTQLRTVSMVFAIISSVVALVAGFILFFVIEPPFLASIFLAAASIAIGCFILTGIAAYFSP